MFVHNFILIVTGETSPGWRAAGMAGGADTIRTVVIDGESMAEIGWQPGAGGMAG